MHSENYYSRQRCFYTRYELTLRQTTKIYKCKKIGKSFLSKSAADTLFDCKTEIELSHVLCKCLNFCLLEKSVKQRLFCLKSFHMVHKCSASVYLETLLLIDVSIYVDLCIYAYFNINWYVYSCTCISISREKSAQRAWPKSQKVNREYSERLTIYFCTFCIFPSFQPRATLVRVGIPEYFLIWTKGKEMFGWHTKIRWKSFFWQQQ